MQLKKIFIITYLTLICCDKKTNLLEVEKKPKSPLKVTTISPKKQGWSDSLEFVGTTTPQQTTFIYAPVNGKILKSFVHLGSYIKKSANLLVIKQDRAGNKFKEHKIASPVNGTVLTKNFNLGEYVQANNEVLQICNLKKLALTINISEKENQYLKPGSSLMISKNKEDHISLPGKIISISAKAHPKFATYETLVEFDNSNNHLSPGMLAFVKVKINNRNNLAVPSSSIDKNNYVWTMDSSNKAQKKKVLVGSEKNKNSEILSGLSSKEKLIISHNNLLKVGDSVKSSNL
jgi:multidrug efflux pump subunit AcrA (membrane-fusion protein)